MVQTETSTGLENTEEGKPPEPPEDRFFVQSHLIDHSGVAIVIRGASYSQTSFKVSQKIFTPMSTSSLVMSLGVVGKALAFPANIGWS